MELTASTWWWIACCVLVALELATGTFYLLMLAIGAAAAAVAAHLDLGITGQLVTAAVVGGGSVAACHARRAEDSPAPPAGENRDVNLDIGERVLVERWEADRTAQVKYRGAAWTARFDGSGMPSPGPHVIRAVDGNRLVLIRASS